MRSMSRRLAVDDRRAQLLEHGVRLFSQHAYDDVGIDDIAREAGVSKGLLYHYFGGKRAFYLATVEHQAEQLLASLAPDPDLLPPERAREGLRRYLDFVEARSDAYIALMRGGLGRDDQAEAIIDRTRQVLAEQVVSALGVDPPPPAHRLAARAWIGAVEAASLDWLAHQDLDREPLIAILLGALAGSVGPLLRDDTGQSAEDASS